MAMMGANAHEAKSRDMPVAAIIQVSNRCECAKNTPRPREHVTRDVEKHV